MTDVVVKWGNREIRGRMLQTYLDHRHYDPYGYWGDCGTVWNFSVHVPPKSKPEDLDMPNVGEFYD